MPPIYWFLNVFFFLLVVLYIYALMNIMLCLISAWISFLVIIMAQMVLEIHVLWSNHYIPSCGNMFQKTKQKKTLHSYSDIFSWQRVHVHLSQVPECMGFILNPKIKHLNPRSIQGLRSGYYALLQHPPKRGGACGECLGSWSVLKISPILELALGWIQWSKLIVLEIFSCYWPI